MMTHGAPGPVRKRRAIFFAPVDRAAYNLDMMKMNKRAIARLAFVSVVGLSVFGCLEMDVPPAGSYSEVLLVSEDGAEDTAARALAAHLTRPIDYYVDEEQPFTVAHIRAADLVDAPEVKNILVCGVANPVSSVGRHITSLLGGGADKIASGEATVFKRENQPGPGQATLVVTAATSEALAEVIESRGEQIVETLEASCRQRLREHLLEREEKQIARKLRESYGFTVNVPAEYRVLSEKSDPPGVELLREAPARLLGVFWIDWDHPPALEDSLALFRARADYVWKRYDGDTMDSTRVAYKISRLGEHPALAMSGYWSNSRALAGGYFETYFVYHAGSKLLWCIDLLAFAPGLPKHPQFRELLALAETFRYD